MRLILRARIRAVDACAHIILLFKPRVSTMDNRENESQAVQATTILVVCPAIAVIFVAMRVYTRFFLTKKNFWEDYMIVIAMVGNPSSPNMQAH
jgi:hypothetical protein